MPARSRPAQLLGKEQTQEPSKNNTKRFIGGGGGLEGALPGDLVRLEHLQLSQARNGFTRTRKKTEEGHRGQPQSASTIGCRNVT